MAKPFIMSNGEELSPEQIEEFVKEAERGYDVSQFKPLGPGRPPLGNGASHAIQCRLDPRAYKALQAHIAETGLNTSTIVREALAQYLSLPE